MSGAATATATATAARDPAAPPPAAGKRRWGRAGGRVAAGHVAGEHVTGTTRLRARARALLAVPLLDAVMVTAASGVVALVAGGEPGVRVALPSPWQPLLWCLVVACSGGYDRRVLDGLAAGERGRLWRSCGGMAVLALTATWVLGEGAVLAATVAAPQLLAATVALQLGRAVRRGAIRRARRRGRARRRVLAVGTVRDVIHLVEHSRRHPEVGFDVTAACVPAEHHGADRRRGERRDGDTARTEDQPPGDRRGERDRRGELTDLFAAGVRQLGEPHQVLAALRQCQADTVVVVGVLGRHALRRLAWQLEPTGVRLLVGSPLTDVTADRVTVDTVGGVPLLRLRPPAFTGGRRLAKDATDRLVAAALLVALAPLLLALAVAVRLTSAGPALYRQRRTGLGGREFDCLKLRTMYTGADRDTAGLTRHSITGDVLFKVRHDPRVTSVGRWLRRYSLDELPQLINVVAGSMSLVGPRPPLPGEVRRYGADVHRRLLVKPGMTGLWQVSGRSDLSWPESVRLDLFYVENWSPALDASVLLRTVGAVLRGRGAY